MDDLYRYRPKRLWLFRVLAIFGGILGAHRFYIGKVFTGLMMLLSAGGGLAWWIFDLTRTRKMVELFNEEEKARQDDGRPPQGLGFLPQKSELDIDNPPAWADKRASRARIHGGGFLLAVIGMSMGAISGSTGHYEATAILLVFIVVTLTAARWKRVARVPVLGSLSRWNHRLRLYYHTMDPGSVWVLALRPLVGIFFAAMRPRDRAEVRLYLQVGVVFSLGFAVLDLIEVSEYESTWAGIGIAVGEFFQTLAYTYAFVAPVGAILVTQLLLSRRDLVVWILSGVNVSAIYLGLFVVGAV